jgi:glycosyltransferase involved in cell wall biosynthesis
MNRWITIVIPALNEADSIGALVAQLRAADYAVIVVDDGSTDETAAIAIAGGATVIRHDRPLGIAAACTAGWKAALQTPATEIVQMDAGGSHDPADIPALLAALSRADMVIGSRFANGGQYHGRPSRARASKLAAAALNFAAGKRHRFSDWTSGFRAWNCNALASLAYLTYAQRMHAWQIEVLARAVRRNIKVAEVGINYTAGASSFRASMAFDAFGEWLWILFS